MKHKILVSPAINDNCVTVMTRLAAAGVQVVGADFTPVPFGVRSRYCQTHYQLGGADRADTGNLLALVKRTRPDAILPINTRATLAAVAGLDGIAALTATNLPAPEAFMAAYSKRACMAECRHLGIPCPDEYSLHEARAFLERAGGMRAVVVKPDRDVGAAAGVRYVRQADALEREVQTCRELFGGALIQEFIPGGTGNLKMILLLFSPESHLMAAFTSRKIRQWPPAGGSVAVSESTAEAHLVEQIRPLFDKWRWRGPAEVDLKLDGRDGRHKILEVNPRFPGYLRFPVHCGLDVATLAARLIVDPRGVTPARFPAYTVGARFLNVGLFLRTAFSEIRTTPSRLRALRDVIGDLRGSSWMIRDMLADPLPPLGRVFLDARESIDARQSRGAGR